MSYSSSYKQFAHLRIPVEKIVSATDNSSDANIIRQDEFGKEYKGQLLLSGQLIDIATRTFDKTHGHGDKEFWTEVSMLSKLEHRNLVRIVGFCDDNGEKVVINKHETNGSLNEHLRDKNLTWMQRLKICVGVAYALSYIHYDKGRDFSVIHRDIKSSKILLDEQWEAKLSGFELSITQPAGRRSRLCLDPPCGTPGYYDPTYAQSGSVTHKSDIYSFGIILFEVMCGKKVRTIDEDSNQYISASSARSHYERGRLEDMIDPVLWKQMNSKSFNIFSETAYCCLKEQRPQRPNILQIIIKLKQALVSQLEHENLAYSIVEGTTTTTTTAKGKDLTHLEIPLVDIESATKNFSNTYRIASGSYGDVYKAELDHFDSAKFLPLEEKRMGKLPKKRSIVAIKRIKIREDQQGEQGFLAEIEMLSNCKHPNIISLYGFCEEGRHMILVYEYASKGSLNDYLGIACNLTNLTWVQRIKICIDIARGLSYLHTKIEDDRRIIHRDIKSDNILLHENWQAKIADFGLSRFRQENQQENNTIHTENIAGTELYLDPEYKMGKLKNESDIYSFGVVLFEILSGRFANDAIYINENINGIAYVARRRFNDKTIMEMIDPRLLEETHENIFTQNRGPDQDSLKAFAEISYRCVAEYQTERPSAEEVIKKLEEALFLQENIKDQLKFSVEDIALATQNFSDNNLIGERGFCKVYRGELTHVVAANGRSNTNIAAKRLDRRSKQREAEFLMELQILLEYKHENIIGLVGYCNEMDERIIVYEYASRRSLDMHLRNNDLTWRKRLEICIDIATALDFLHGGSLTQEVVIHRHINSNNVLLTHDWKAKIVGFERSLISPINKDIAFVIDDAVGTFGYVDPLYIDSVFVTQVSDIYSFGVVLFEILCGRLALDSKCEDRLSRFLTQLVKHKYKEGILDELVFEGIKEQISPKSLTTFQTIALQCLQQNREEQPTTPEVLLQLKEALEFQDDYEIWEPKLPKDYKKIFQMANSPDIYSTLRAKDLYNMLCNGILLQQGKLSLSERLPAITIVKTNFIGGDAVVKLYSGPQLISILDPPLAEMLDILNLRIKIKTKAQLLSRDVVYGVFLVFKFCGTRKVSSQTLYVNLKYKIGSKTSHAYFATWRDDNWMMIELWRFLNENEDIVFKFLLDSFLGYNCGDSTIFVEGIEFRPVDNVITLEEIGEVKQVQQASKSDSNMDLLQQSMPTNPEEILKRLEHDDDEKVSLTSKVNGKKHLMLSAKAAIYDSANVKLFKAKPSVNQSRFPEVIELLPQQVFRINCAIKGEMLSRDADYECYLVFKLSKKCHGLHCPVQVRDLLHWSDAEADTIYFRSPKPWNLHDANQVPTQRTDGWMEVKLWKFNLSKESEDDDFYVNLRLFSYEGTMSGLIVCGLEFRLI